jgi:hypothetical protein
VRLALHLRGLPWRGRRAGVRACLARGLRRCRGKGCLLPPFGVVLSCGGAGLPVLVSCGSGCAGHCFVSCRDCQLPGWTKVSSDLTSSSREVWGGWHCCLAAALRGWCKGGFKGLCKLRAPWGLRGVGGSERKWQCAWEGE